MTSLSDELAGISHSITSFDFFGGVPVTSGVESSA